MTAAERACKTLAQRGPCWLLAAFGGARFTLIRYPSQYRSSCHSLTQPITGDIMAKPPNYKQEKKRREEAQKRRNEQEQQRQVERKNKDLPPAR
jgi:hypothetical protein